MNALGFVDVVELVGTTVLDFRNNHKHRRKCIIQHLSEDIQRLSWNYNNKKQLALCMEYQKKKQR